MKPRNRGFLFLPITLAAIVSVAVAFQKTNNSVDSQPLANVPANPTVANTVEAPMLHELAANQDEAEGKVLLLTIRPNGFEPSEITVPAGNYLVVVRNRSGLDEFNARLERGSGEVLRQVRVGKHKRDWKHLLRLNAGSYVLRGMDQADWICRITITD